MLMKLKSLEPKDIKKVMKIENECFTGGVRQSKEDLLRTIQNENQIGIIASGRFGKPIGYVLGAPLDFYGNIDDEHQYNPDGTFYGESLAVMPKERGKGIGSLMLAAMLLEARKKGFKRYVSHAHETLGFREAFNPKVIREIPEYYGDGKKAIYYEIDLNSLIEVSKNDKERS